MKFKKGTEGMEMKEGTSHKYEEKNNGDCGSGSVRNSGCSIEAA